MSKQPPQPVLKVDLLSSAVAGSTRASCARAASLTPPCTRRHHRRLRSAQQGFGHVRRRSDPSSPPAPAPSNVFCSLTADDLFMPGLPLGMWIGQMCARTASCAACSCSHSHPNPTLSQVQSSRRRSCRRAGKRQGAIARPRRHLAIAALAHRTQVVELEKENRKK